MDSYDYLLKGQELLQQNSVVSKIPALEYFLKSYELIEKDDIMITKLYHYISICYFGLGDVKNSYKFILKAKESISNFKKNNILSSFMENSNNELFSESEINELLNYIIDNYNTNF